MSTEQKPKREIPKIYSQVKKETTVLRKRNAPGVSLDKVKPYFSYYLNHEMTISEIAEKTEMSINAVKSTIARARKVGILPPVTEESIKIAKSRAHLGRGRLQNMILPDLLQGCRLKK
ncbi:MAG: sigma-70 region 4 domain-containing protein [Nitrososphaeria archaeon]